MRIQFKKDLQDVDKMFKNTKEIHCFYYHGTVRKFFLLFVPFTTCRFHNCS